ncbi:hypothetical protein [Cyclobacterium marinum]|uniref:Uncharacterized protein n=1 Tax=Cyclobacterium marinum (strain ATCC 25205 / DSM 745 / LMG 13164 / NCIMB 1802) TaxID=880070 RepID=G0J1Y3_CYCMS|nr:hypothetical protein [Cyclobacterium marinum]AEL23989.1 hypothetical protein Cycma_0206 [Cyclobacterium marinum DSM 745]
MTKLRKESNISYFEKLFPLIENHKNIKGLVKSMDSVIHFIKKAIEKNPDFDSDGEEYIETLTFWKEAFNQSQYQDPSWGMYIMNKRRNILINIRPITEILTSVDWDPENEVDLIINYITMELLDDDNVLEYKKIIETLNLLKLFFNDYIPES